MERKVGLIILFICGLVFTNCEQAAEKFRNPAKIQPRTPAEVEKKLRKWERQLASLEGEFNKRFELVSKMGELSKKLALGYTKMARFELAGRQYHKAIQYEAGTQNPTGHFRQAINYYEKAFIYARVDDELLYQAALVYANASRVMGWEPQAMATAMTLYTGIIKKDPRHTRAYFQRAILNFKGYDRPKAAIDDLHALLRVDASDIGAHQLLGQIYFSRRENRLALQSYQRALGLIESELLESGIKPGKNESYKNIRSIVETLSVTTNFP